MKILTHHWHLPVLAAIIAGILALTLKPYDGNISALFHIDRSIADTYEQPEGTVVLDMPGYDGMEYWQMARNMPILFSPDRWDEIRSLPPGPYAHQRFLLPLLAFIASLGDDALLPYVFLLINALSLIGAAFLMSRIAKGKKSYAIALALCPAAIIGMHFMLAEPLNLPLITLFLYRYLKNERIDAINAVLLALCVLTREINLLLVLATLGYTLYRARWKQLPHFLIPLGAFLLLHGFIYAVFHEKPFFWSTDKSTLPLVAIWELLSGQKGYGILTLSSIALFLAFVLPAFARVATDIAKTKRVEFLSLMSAAFLALMLLMPDHIWGSITSIGRVITPVYPLFLTYAATRDTMIDRALAVAIGALGIGAGVGLALIEHPFFLT